MVTEEFYLLGVRNKSSVVENVNNSGHHIQFQNINILSTRYRQRMYNQGGARAPFEQYEQR
jgi:hypothetical protein